MTPSRLPVATEITSDRLVLEPLRVGHAPELAAVLDDTRLHEFTGGEPASPEELTARYERQVTGRSADGTQQWFNWVLRRRGDGRAAGYLQATTWPDETGDLVAELAWVVAVPHQGAGLAREAAAAVARWLAARGVGRFVAHVHPGHAASAAVARSLGLAPTATVVDGEVCWAGPAQSTT